MQCVKLSRTILDTLKSNGAKLLLENARCRRLHVMLALLQKTEPPGPPSTTPPITDLTPRRSDITSYEQKMDLKGKVAVVTEGHGGVGYLVTQLLLQKGVKDVLHSGAQKREDLAAKSKLLKEYGDKVSFVQGSITNSTHLPELFILKVAKKETVDIFVNNEFADRSSANWEHQLRLNVEGLLGCCEAALTHMGKHAYGRGGVFINTYNLEEVHPEGKMHTQELYEAMSFSYGNPAIVQSSGLRFITFDTGLTHRKEEIGDAIMQLALFAPTATVWQLRDSKLLRLK